MIKIDPKTRLWIQVIILLTIYHATGDGWASTDREISLIPKQLIWLTFRDLYPFPSVVEGTYIISLYNPDYLIGVKPGKKNKNEKHYRWASIHPLIEFINEWLIIQMFSDVFQQKLVCTLSHVYLYDCFHSNAYKAFGVSTVSKSKI